MMGAPRFEAGKDMRAVADRMYGSIGETIQAFNDSLDVLDVLAGVLERDYPDVWAKYGHIVVEAVEGVLDARQMLEDFDEALRDSNVPELNRGDGGPVEVAGVSAKCYGDCWDMLNNLRNKARSSCPTFFGIRLAHVKSVLCAHFHNSGDDVDEAVAVVERAVSLFEDAQNRVGGLVLLVDHLLVMIIDREAEADGEMDGGSL